MIYETTILVDSFWRNLSKDEFLIQELIVIGVAVVDRYLDVKQ
jgi:hypothetical protein